MEPPNPHDALFRSVFSNPEHAAGELRHILGPRLAAPIVWSSLSPCPGSFVDEALRGRHSDLLFTAACGQKAVLLYLLFEHQSTDDPLMAYRILVYLVRIWEQHLRYIFVVSNPAEPEDLVKQLVAVVGQRSKEEVMSVADWLEQKGRLDKGRRMLLKLLRARFGEVPASAQERIQAAEEDQLDTWLDRILSAPTLDDVLAGA